MNNNTTTKLTKEGKILLLNILKSRQITPEQKTKLLELLEMETTTFIFGDSDFIDNFNKELENEKKELEKEIK